MIEPLFFLTLLAPAVVDMQVFASGLIEVIEIFGIPLVGLGAYGAYKAAEWQRRNKVITGREGLIGAKGVVKRSLKPFGRRCRGKVMVFGEWWEAVSDEPISAGATIEVEAVEGFTLFVVERLPS